MRRLATAHLFKTIGRCCSALSAGGVSCGPSKVSPIGGSASRFLDDVAELSSSDKEMIRRNLADPKNAPASRMGGSGIGPAAGDMVAAFTCSVCETRSVKRFTKHSYTKGIVIVECPGCFNKHLLADNLGWFDDENTNIEQVLRAKGEEFVRVGGLVYVEDVKVSSLTEEELSASQNPNKDAK